VISIIFIKENQRDMFAKKGEERGERGRVHKYRQNENSHNSTQKEKI
jgi:hypothetical protein